jgi:hypothetical protein
MSLAIGHFALGATATALVVTYLLPKLPYPRTLVLLGGVWSLLPDAAKLFSAAPRLVAFHESQWANAFWFHRALDRFDAADSPRTSAVLVAVLLLVTFVVERRDYRTHARLGKAYDELDLPTR